MLTVFQITPAPGQSFTARLQAVAKEHPIAEFDTSILLFIRALQQSLTPPLIAQLESEEAIDGLSVHETEAFKQRVGLRAR